MLDLKNTTYMDIKLRRPNMYNRLELWLINGGKRYVYFGVWIMIQVALFTIAYFQLQGNPVWSNMHKLLGTTFLTARASALALHVDTALVLYPVCRTTITWVRRTPLNRVIPFDHALLFHQIIGYSIVLFTFVHAASHYYNYYLVMKATGVSYWFLMFATGHGLTGNTMMAVILVMGYTAREKVRRRHFNWFWNLHHLFVVYFALFSIHGSFCLLKYNLPPYCVRGGSFWKFWVGSGVLYLFERLAREFRAERRSRAMKVQKVILHPSKVVEVQLRKPSGFNGLAGQYAFINCPAVSTQQWHPFTLTSAPEEDYVSMHIRVCGDWTTAFSEALGATPEHWRSLEKSRADSGKSQEEKPKKGGESRDTMLYAPIPSKSAKKGSGLASSRPNTMLLVDNTHGRYGHGAAMMPNGAGLHPTQKRNTGFMSRISYYLGANSGGSGSGGGGGAGNSQSPSFGHTYYQQQHMRSMHTSDAEPIPKVPSLKQLQEYYLKKGREEAGLQMSHQQKSFLDLSSPGSTAIDEMDAKEIRDSLKKNSFESISIGKAVSGNKHEKPAETNFHASILPQVLVDGPFGSASEDVFDYEVTMLFCAGIGCTPFASVLKSIWYRLNYARDAARLRKVYFFWVQRDTKSFEWFQDLLKAIEEEEDARREAYEDIHAYSLKRATGDQMIEIHSYLTGKLSMMQLANVHLNKGDVDPITGLKSPTNFGRPNMDLIFRAVAHAHPCTNVGVFFCGPAALGSSIKSAAKKWTNDSPDGTKFYYNKENF